MVSHNRAKRRSGTHTLYDGKLIRSNRVIWFSPIMIIFFLLWVAFILLILAETSVRGLFWPGITMGQDILAGVWAAWGIAWVILAVTAFSYWKMRKWHVGSISYDGKDVFLYKLKKRLARGEISLKEYREIVRELRRR